MRAPLWMTTLLAGLLAACAASAPIVRPEVPLSHDEALADSTVWAEPVEAAAPLIIQQVSSEGGAEGPTPPLPRGQPLTRARLWGLARSQGIGLHPLLVRRNWEVGIAFQHTVCRSLRVAVNTTLVDTPGRGAHKQGVPDARLLAIRVNVKGWPTFLLDGAFLDVLGSELPDFMEVKAQQRPITLSTGQGQIRGYILSLAAKRPHSFTFGIMQGPRPALLLVTTSDTHVAEEVPFEAGRRGVAIYHAVVWEDAGLLNVGPFRQLTGFADVPPLFMLPSTPRPLQREQGTP